MSFKMCVEICDCGNPKNQRLEISYGGQVGGLPLDCRWLLVCDCCNSQFAEDNKFANLCQSCLGVESINK